MGRVMKDSGVEWIGEIPDTWNVRKLKNTVICNQDKGSFSGGAYIALENIESGSGRLISSEGEIQVDSTVTTFNNQSVLFGKLRPYLAKVARPSYAGQCSTEILVLTPLACCDKDYLFWCLISPMFIDNVNAATFGVKMPRANWNFIGGCFLPIPSTTEQRTISAFLDSKCAKINSIIDQTRTSIEEYKQLKQAVITRAVTKGVRSDRPMKESGIAWIGKVPEKWDIVNLGKHMTIESGISVGKTYETGTLLVEVPYLRVANVQGDHVDFSDIATIFVTPEEAEKYKLRAGQMLMTEGGDRDKLGRGCKWNGEIENCIHQNHVFAVQTDDGLLTDYLDYLTTSDVARTYFDITAKKTTNLACTNKTTIQRFTIPVPPVDEQGEICTFLDNKCAKLNSLITKKEQLLTELESYKKSLIYEYVTGKKEVI